MKPEEQLLRYYEEWYTVNKPPDTATLLQFAAERITAEHEGWMETKREFEELRTMYRELEEDYDRLAARLRDLEE